MDAAKQPRIFYRQTGWQRYSLLLRIKLASLCSLRLTRRSTILLWAVTVLLLWLLHGALWPRYKLADNLQRQVSLSSAVTMLNWRLTLVQRGEYDRSTVRAAVRCATPQCVRGAKVHTTVP